jgi:hypothetical protein
MSAKEEIYIISGMTGSQAFREAEPRGLGLAPEIQLTDCLLFPEKEAKSVVPLRGMPEKEEIYIVQE